MADIITDFIGPRSYLNPKNPYNIVTPSYNVFFYPYPFVIEDYMDPHVLGTFVLTKDVEINIGVLPSKNTWNDKYKKDYLKSCNEVESDINFRGRDYDPCLDGNFIKEYKNVVGGVYIADTDVFQVTGLWGNKLDTLKFRRYFRDNSDDIGVPEIILYPFKERKMESVSTLKENATYQWLMDHLDDYNYKPLLISDLKPEDRTNSTAFTHLEKLLSPEGLIIDKSTYHMTVDPLTHFYMIAELTDSEVLKRCIPLEEPDKLKFL